MNGIYFKKVWDLETIKKMYGDIQIIQNENNIQELGFKTKKLAEMFITGASELWPLWVSSEDTVTMYFFAEIIKEMYDGRYITKKDLYSLSEQEIINLIKKCENKEISNLFKKFINNNEFLESEEYMNNKFCVNKNAKRRYINPLTLEGRIYDISNDARKKIDEYKNMKISKYAYVNL